jgi:membrane protease YdiL (CAAX protease family)
MNKPPSDFALTPLLRRVPATQRADVRLAWRRGLLVTLCIGAAKHFGPLRIAFGLGAAAMQIWIPLRHAERSAAGDEGIGYRFDRLGRDATWALVLAALTLIPFWFLHNHWWALIGGGSAVAPQLQVPAGDLAPWLNSFGWALGDGLGTAIGALELTAIHLLGVALPEELFYRGYLQPHLCRGFVDKALPFGFRWNHGIALAAALFAAAHFLGEYNPARLAPFFPALLFGMLRRRNGSIVAPMLLHGGYNIFAALMFTGMRAGS